MSDSDDTRVRSDSGSDSSLLGHPISFQRQKSGGEDTDVSSLDYSYLDVDALTVEIKLILHVTDFTMVTSINISGNQLKCLPSSLTNCVNLQVLDISQNLLTEMDTQITQFPRLTTLILSNNQLEHTSFPKEFGIALSNSLKVLSLGGNQLKCMPREVYDLCQLRSLYLGGNAIEKISRDIKKLVNLRVLYLGGNHLTSIPTEVGMLSNLQSLSLCENRLRSLPSSIAMLRNLRSLALHKNQLTVLPTEIVRLRGLVELSLRANPLVARFVKDYTFNTPSLLELAGRAVKTYKLSYTHQNLPMHLVNYLEAARRCVNPKCKGVYFDAHVEQIKFVDFCGIYRLPLLQYLCSPGCSGNNIPAFHSSSSDSEENSNDVPLNKLRRVLLG